MRSHQIFRTCFPLVLFVFLFCVSGTAQSNVCKSVTAKGTVRCGTVAVEFKNVTSNKLAGKVESRVSLPILVEIYKIDKKEMEASSEELTHLKKPLMTIETDDEGEFCHSGLSDGYYVIRLGTPYSDWNCAWVKVHILRSSTFRKVKVELSLGV